MSVPRLNGRLALFAASIGLILMAARPVHAQRAPFPIPDPDPEVERKSFILADGFEVNLFAADPLIAKPIQMNFDSTGRLWIVSSEVYPQIKPGQVANDKVLILEDADGDGKAEKTTIFADGLLIPTGIEPGDGGAYVGNSTELLHLKDADGDGKADKTRVVLSGFGTEDTHHIIHTLRWGHDGMLYFNQSIYIHSHIETPHGVRRLNGGGIWRFRPETMQLDVLIRGLVNSWGHQIDTWGQSFATDGAGGEGINYCLPGAYYVTSPDAVRILQGLNPGSPKHCGLDVASGRHLPDDWQGLLLTNDFRGNRVCRFKISDDGAGYASRELSELIKTSHMAFRPIDVKVGPDGAIYIADWYNPIIQHGEVDFRDDRRDHTRGRIWRVTAKNRPLVERPKLVDASVESLLDSLKAPEDWTRHHAKRVLKERGAGAVLPVLADWVKRLPADDPSSEHHRLEALWMYQALDTPEPELLNALLNSKDARVRAAAVRVVQFWQDRLSNPLALLAARVEDEHPRVRLEAVRVLASIPGTPSAEIAMRALDRPVDRFLDYALWLTARQLQADWLPEVQAGRFDFQGNPKRLVFALQSVGSPDVLQPLIEMFRGGRVPAEHEANVQSLIASLGGPAELALVLDLAQSDASLSPSRKLGLLRSLLRATRERKVVPSGDLNKLSVLLEQGDPYLLAEAAKAVGLWKAEALRPRLVEFARSNETPMIIRSAAIEGLLSLGDPESRELVNAMARDQATPREFQMSAITALIPHDASAIALAAGWLGRLPSEQAALGSELLTRVLDRRDGPTALAKALSGQSISPDVARLCIRTVRASGRPDPELLDALAKSGNLTAGTRTMSAEELHAFLTEVAKSGDATRGEAIFRRDELTCLKCHSIAGAGGLVGPGLESIGASAQPDYLVDSLLEPSKAVKENYHATVVATDDGRVLNGIRVRQTDSDLVIRDADDRELAIPLSSIEEQKPGGSLMPAGLTDSLTRAELADLVRFLSQLGKIGPYSVSKDRVFRRWQALRPSGEISTALIRTSIDAVVQDSNVTAWDSVYTNVGGELPLAELPVISRGGFAGPLTILRTQVSVTTPGAVAIGFNAMKGLSFWIDGRRVEPLGSASSLAVELPTGIHSLTVAIDRTTRMENPRVTLEDVAGSPARAQVVLGK